MPSGSLTARGLTKHFGPAVALAGVDLRVATGEFVVLVGPNGAGKTTLLRLLATLARPTAGELRIAGLDPQREGRAVRRHLGFLSHQTLLYEALTARQNLAFYARLYALEDAEVRIETLLHRVDLWPRRDDLVRTYSRGMQQRLAVARAVLHRPSILLLDEPYTGLDPLAAEQLTLLLAELTEEGTTVLLTTHTLEPVRLAGQRVVVLNGGRIVHDGAVAAGATAEGAAFGALYRQLMTGAGEAVAPVAPESREFEAPAATAPEGGWLAGVGALLHKELAAEWQTREIFNAMAVFAALALLIFSFALDLRGALARETAAGVLWTTLAFAGTLGLSRSFVREEQNGGMEGLLLAPIERVAIFFGKAGGNLLSLLLLALLLLPLGTVLFDVPLLRPAVLGVLVLGSVGYTAVGTLLAAMAVNTRAREVLLPILLLPLTIPLLIAAVRATGGLLAGLSLADVGAWLRLLVVYDLVMIAVGMLTFPYAVGEGEK